MEKKIRVLALCDSPTSATGFAQVSRNVLRGLARTGKYEIDVIGINYHGDYYDRETHPYNIYPAMPQGYNDMYGRGRLIDALKGREVQAGLKPPWDIVFTIQDPFIIEGLGINFPFGDQIRVSSEMWRRSVPPEYWFKWIAYFPVDADLKENWVTRSIALPDVPVAYCNWGREKMLRWDRKQFELKFKLALSEGEQKRDARLFLPSLKERVQVVPHGVDVDVFKPLSDKEKKEFRKYYFGGEIKDDTYLVVNISRNQPRKDLARTIAAFAMFKQRVPNSHLYLHCKVDDIGGSVNEIARHFDLHPGEDYSVPSNFNAGIGFSVDVVNKIYNIADLCVTTTLGEGWGFITTEAMATKTPVIAPYITSIIDIFGGPLSELQFYKHMRGIPVKAGSTSSEWVCLGLEDNERIRPLTNIDDLVDKMVWAYKNRNTEPMNIMLNRAYKWVQNLNWGVVVAQWDELFMATYDKLKSERRTGELIDKAGRNDPCPCGSGEKFKKCHGDPEREKVKYNDWLVQQGA